MSSWDSTHLVAVVSIVNNLELVLRHVALAAIFKANPVIVLATANWLNINDHGKGLSARFPLQKFPKSVP
jgi:hypothetical protein